MSIELTDPRDKAFAAIAQGALVNVTILPSGFTTPARDMRISGTTLVEATDYQPKEETREVSGRRPRPAHPRGSADPKPRRDLPDDQR